MGLLLAALKEAKLLPPVSSKISNRRARRHSGLSEVIAITEDEIQHALEEKKSEQDSIIRERAIRSPPVVEDVVVMHERETLSPTVEENARLEEHGYQARVAVEVNPETRREKSSSRSPLVLVERTMAYEKEYVYPNTVLALLPDHHS